MRRIDYDAEQYRNYTRGRALSERQMQVWLDAFAALLPEQRPLSGLDVGSGTGRFTPALADAFGPVTGVEPSARMREIAETAHAHSPHPGVQYLAGSAEEIPVPAASADYALMFLSWAHVQDKPRAVEELARVLRPGGRLLLRTQFSDHLPDLWWLRPLPRGEEVHASHFQPLHEVIAMFTSAGSAHWRVVSYGTVLEPSPGTYGEMLERLRLRTFSVFGGFTPDELETGFRGLEESVADHPDAPAPAEPATLLTLERR
jgi:ubiquinone/menaquinone biosynthesis C-methylase UbiE